jgi:hypothetical protein
MEQAGKHIYYVDPFSGLLTFLGKFGALGRSM